MVKWKWCIDLYEVRNCLRVLIDFDILVICICVLVVFFLENINNNSELVVLVLYIVVWWKVMSNILVEYFISYYIVSNIIRFFEILLFMVFYMVFGDYCVLLLKFGL